jgi:hypothetical protein
MRSAPGHDEPMPDRSVLTVSGKSPFGNGCFGEPRKNFWFAIKKDSRTGRHSMTDYTDLLKRLCDPASKGCCSQREEAAEAIAALQTEVARLMPLVYAIPPGGQEPEGVTWKTAFERVVL